MLKNEKADIPSPDTFNDHTVQLLHPRELQDALRCSVCELKENHEQRRAKSSVCMIATETTTTNESTSTGATNCLVLLELREGYQVSVRDGHTSVEVVLVFNS